MKRTRCEWVQQELRGYRDGAVSPITSILVKIHLKRCEGCRRDLEMIDRIRKELRDMEMATQTAPTSQADALDPGLRARILAAIPSEAPLPPRSSLFPLGGRPMMALGVAATAIIIGFIFFPRFLSPVFNQEAHRAETSDTASSSIATTHSGSVASRLAKPEDGPAVSGGAPAAAPTAVIPMSAAKGPVSLYAQSRGSSGANGYDATGKSGSFGGGGAGGGTANSANAPANSASLKNSQLSNNLPTADFRRGSGLSFGSAGETYTFVAKNLAEGEKTVRRAAAECQGSVAAPSLQNGVAMNPIEIRVTLPASRVSSLLYSISRNSGGAVRLQPQAATIIQPTKSVISKNSIAFSDGHAKGLGGMQARGKQVPVDQEKAKQAETQSGSFARSGGGNGGRQQQHGVTGPQIHANSQSQAVVTLTIEIVKGL